MKSILPLLALSAVLAITIPAAAHAQFQCEDQCQSDYEACIFSTCRRMITCDSCEADLFVCRSQCQQPTCLTDTCATCGRPSTTATDGDADGVPDQLEYDLAHQFFPNLWLQHADMDLYPSYFYNGWSIPFTVQPVYQGFCDLDKECLEIRYGLAYTQDYGDNILGLTSHFGDDEFYVALVQRTADWSVASASASSWQMIRDFTSAHFSTADDSSRYGAYGNCPAACGAYMNDEQGCLANSQWCSWSRSLCWGVHDNNGGSCLNHWEQEDCQFSGCTWRPSSCTAPVAIWCDSATPVTAAPNFYVAERKHGVYHTPWECENGGAFNADACPYNLYDLRGYKAGKLQNIGTQSVHQDSVIQGPDGCTLYDVWSGYEFGATGSDFKRVFTYQFNWDIPRPPLSPTGPRF